MLSSWSLHCSCLLLDWVFFVVLIAAVVIIISSSITYVVKSHKKNFQCFLSCWSAGGIVLFFWKCWVCFHFWKRFSLGIEITYRKHSEDITLLSIISFKKSALYLTVNPVKVICFFLLTASKFVSVFGIQQFYYDVWCSYTWVTWIFGLVF